MNHRQSSKTLPLDAFKLQLPQRVRRATFLVLLMVTPLAYLPAQTGINYAIHANIIYHFTKYIDWPPERKTGDLIIGVIGDTPLFNDLTKIVANKKAGTQKITVKRYSSSQQSYDCHILFLSEDESTSLKKVCTRTAGSPLLLVCEEEGFAARGACINFKLVSDRLKLEINKNNIEQRQLKIANELLRLGEVVK